MGVPPYATLDSVPDERQHKKKPSSPQRNKRNERKVKKKGMMISISGRDQDENSRFSGMVLNAGGVTECSPG
jgi:hypothetical protein